jgi:hypothetical protein
MRLSDGLQRRKFADPNRSHTAGRSRDFWHAPGPAH